MKPTLLTVLALLITAPAWLSACQYGPAVQQANIQSTKIRNRNPLEYFVLTKRNKMSPPVGFTELLTWGTGRYSDVHFDLWVVRKRDRLLEKIGTIDFSELVYGWIENFDKDYVDIGTCWEGGVTWCNKRVFRVGLSKREVAELMERRKKVNHYFYSPHRPLHDLEFDKQGFLQWSAYSTTNDPEALY
jgi:hypothetical protein